jgi:hypothetical protein
MGSPLIGVAPAEWSGPALLRAARDVAAARFGYEMEVDLSFVSYSFPKLAVRVTPDSGVPVLLEVGTWEEVPQRSDAPSPGNFEAWSYLDEVDADIAQLRRERFETSVAELLDLRTSGIADSNLVSSAIWSPIVPIESTNSRTLHYSTIDTDHTPCYELRGQQQNVWCVAASVQMLLDFYRYHLDQSEIAGALGLGPNGLPYGDEQQVVTTLEALTNNALNAHMIVPGAFDDFTSEINRNRPLISFIPGHARSVAGYTQTTSPLTSLNFEGLLVYDPWPPNAGVITRWENYAAGTYRMLFKAGLSALP